MALTGQLTDLSLAELIEFFCNQRKTGRLKVVFPQAPGYFYIQAGALVDARIGTLSGVEAVYYALALPNASFKFSPAFEATRRTIHQPWTQVLLEGLRRLDEGLVPTPEFIEAVGGATEEDALDDITEVEVENLETFKTTKDSAPLEMTVSHASRHSRKRWMITGAVVLAIFASLAAISIPAGWYGNGKQGSASASIPPIYVNQSTLTHDDSTAGSQSVSDETQSNGTAATDAAAPSNEVNAAARREREARDRERLLRAAEERANAAANKQPETDTAQTATAKANTNTAKPAEAAKPGPKTVSVQVTYDEAGRVTQASGGDPTAIRIARQKRFPTGKPGSTTITIPVN